MSVNIIFSLLVSEMNHQHVLFWGGLRQRAGFGARAWLACQRAAARRYHLVRICRRRVFSHCAGFDHDAAAAKIRRNRAAQCRKRK